MRISIKKHNQSYLHRLAAQMETTESEALNYLLIELRRVNFSFGSQVNLGISTSVVSEQPIEPGQLAMSGLSAIADETDPVLEHFVSIGLEQF